MTVRATLRCVALAGGVNVVCLMSGASCVVGLSPPPPVTVELYNSTGLNVQPRLHASPTAAEPTELFVADHLVAFTTRRFQELLPGETIALELACRDVASLGVTGAVLFDPVNVTTTVSADRPFLLRDDAFACGSRVRFVYFTENDVFHVRVEIE